jgi:protocatechuate 3,4-dioxygenase beta subunit
MKNTDRPTVAGLSRRDAMLMISAILAAPACAQSLPAQPPCVLTPAQTEGPYFSDLRLDRADIRSDPTDGVVKPGVPLVLALRVHAVSATRCVPLVGAVVDIWHCDATGIYSDVADPSFDTRGKKFLRGYQATGTDGTVRFLTIYPGWYPGRAVHIHFKVRAGIMELTSQLYFPDALSDTVLARAPYSVNAGNRTRNEGDGIFRRGGAQLMLAPVAQPQGYAAFFDIGMRIAG